MFPGLASYTKFCKFSSLIFLYPFNSFFFLIVSSCLQFSFLVFSHGCPHRCVTFLKLLLFLLLAMKLLLIYLQRHRLCFQSSHYIQWLQFIFICVFLLILMYCFKCSVCLKCILITPNTHSSLRLSLGTTLISSSQHHVVLLDSFACHFNPLSPVSDGNMCAYVESFSGE